MDRLHSPHAAGCVIFAPCERETCVLIILDQYGKWTFPKGHLEPGETARDAAIREVFEETGITGQIGTFIDSIYYMVINKRGEEVRKQVDFFVMTTTQTTPTLQTEEGIHAYQWLSPAVAVTQIGYEQHKTILIKAVQLYDQA